MVGLLRPDEPFVASNANVVREVGMTLASVLGHIAFAETAGGARLTARQISQEVGVSEATAKRATRRLRDLGVITAERAAAWDATLVYRVVWNHPVIAGQPESVTLPLSRGASRSSRRGHLAPVLYSERKEQLQEPHAAVAAEPRQEDRMPVPPSAQEALIPAVAAQPTGPRKDAGMLVARWVDGYRESNGHDAPGPLMKRVAGQMRNLARSCDTHPDWVAAHQAAYDAGVAGRTDAVQMMARQRSRSSARRNVFADPALGGPGAAAVTALSGFLGHRELGQ